MSRQFQSSNTEARLIISQIGDKMRIAIDINGSQKAGVTITQDLFPNLLKAIIEVGNDIVDTTKQ